MTFTAITRRTALAGLATVTMARFAGAQDVNAPMIWGEANSYSQWTAFTLPYRLGWSLALNEINASGGVLGRRVEIESRDDGGTPGDALRAVDELVSRDKASLLFGSFLSNVAVAVADYAHRRKIPYFAVEPLTDVLTLSHGNRYTFRLRPSVSMQVMMLVEEAMNAGVNRWAIVAPNYEYGQSAAEAFKRLLTEKIPDAEIVAELYPALGKIEAGATVAAIERTKPIGLFNVLFGADLIQFVREGNARGFFTGKTVLSLLTGEPEWLLPLKDEAPEGWIVTGYPWRAITDAKHKAFIDAYRLQTGETPRMGSLLGYMTPFMLRDAIHKAGSLDAEKLVTALEGMEFDTIIGRIVMRSEDHQASMGAWVGRLGRDEDDMPTMIDWRYKDGTAFLPSLDRIKAERRQ